jgi:hypothetical protein
MFLDLFPIDVSKNAILGITAVCTMVWNSDTNLVCIRSSSITGVEGTILNSSRWNSIKLLCYITYLMHELSVGLIWLGTREPLGTMVR